MGVNMSTESPPSPAEFWASEYAILDAVVTNMADQGIIQDLGGGLEERRRAWSEWRKAAAVDQAPSIQDTQLRAMVELKCALIGKMRPRRNVAGQQAVFDALAHLANAEGDGVPVAAAALAVELLKSDTDASAREIELAALVLGYESILADGLGASKFAGMDPAKGLDLLRAAAKAKGTP